MLMFVLVAGYFVDVHQDFDFVLRFGHGEGQGAGETAPVSPIPAMSKMVGTVGAGTSSTTGAIIMDMFMSPVLDGSMPCSNTGPFTPRPWDLQQQELEVTHGCSRWPQFTIQHHLRDAKRSCGRCETPAPEMIKATIAAPQRPTLRNATAADLESFISAWSSARASSTSDESMPASLAAAWAHLETCQGPALAPVHPSPAAPNNTTSELSSHLAPVMDQPLIVDAELLQDINTTTSEEHQLLLPLPCMECQPRAKTVAMSKPSRTIMVHPPLFMPSMAAPGGTAPPAPMSEVDAAVMGMRHLLFVIASAVVLLCTCAGFKLVAIAWQLCTPIATKVASAVSWAGVWAALLSWAEWLLPDLGAVYSCVCFTGMCVSFWAAVSLLPCLYAALPVLGGALWLLVATIAHVKAWYGRRSYRKAMHAIGIRLTAVGPAPPCPNTQLFTWLRSLSGEVVAKWARAFALWAAVCLLACCSSVPVPAKCIACCLALCVTIVTGWRLLVCAGAWAATLPRTLCAAAWRWAACVSCAVVRALLAAPQLLLELTLGLALDCLLYYIEDHMFDLWATPVVVAKVQLALLNAGGWAGGTLCIPFVVYSLLGLAVLPIMWGGVQLVACLLVPALLTYCFLACKRGCQRRLEAAEVAWDEHLGRVLATVTGQDGMLTLKHPGLRRSRNIALAAACDVRTAAFWVPVWDRLLSYAEWLLPDLGFVAAMAAFYGATASAIAAVVLMVVYHPLACLPAWGIAVRLVFVGNECCDARHARDQYVRTAEIMGTERSGPAPPCPNTQLFTWLRSLSGEVVAKWARVVALWAAVGLLACCSDLSARVTLYACCVALCVTAVTGRRLLVCGAAWAATVPGACVRAPQQLAQAAWECLLWYIREELIDLWYLPVVVAKVCVKVMLLVTYLVRSLSTVFMVFALILMVAEPFDMLGIALLTAAVVWIALTLVGAVRHACSGWLERVQVAWWDHRDASYATTTGSDGIQCLANPGLRRDRNIALAAAVDSMRGWPVVCGCFCVQLAVAAAPHMWRLLIAAGRGVERCLEEAEKSWEQHREEQAAAEAAEAAAAAAAAAPVVVAEVRLRPRKAALVAPKDAPKDAPKSPTAADQDPPSLQKRKARTIHFSPVKASSPSKSAAATAVAPHLTTTSDAVVRKLAFGAEVECATPAFAFAPIFTSNTITTTSCTASELSFGGAWPMERPVRRTPAGASSSPFCGFQVATSGAPPTPRLFGTSCF
jgi:hypothetical protein